MAVPRAPRAAAPAAALAAAAVLALCAVGVADAITPPPSFSEGPSPDDEIQFQMYTRSHPDEFQRLERPELTDFDASRPTVLMAHGYTGSGGTETITMVKDAVLSAADAHFVAVHWGPLATGEYRAAANHTAAVAARVAWLLDLLHSRWAAPLPSLHVVGFSLGAHVAAQVSDRMRSGRLARITALDPARLDFESRPPSMRLDAGDADLVVVVHTAGGVIAFAEPLGHVDFYPNGGGSPQPACTKEAFPVVCSHALAPRYLAEAVLRLGSLLGVRCPSLRDFEEGLCDGGDTAPLGLFHNYTSLGSFFLWTSDSPPYGLGKKGVRSSRAEGDEEDNQLESRREGRTRNLEAAPKAGAAAAAGAGAALWLLLVLAASAGH